MERKDVKLLPCPFCGLTPLLGESRTHFGIYKIVCICGMHYDNGEDEYGMTLEEVVKGYNTRK